MDTPRASIRGPNATRPRAQSAILQARRRWKAWSFRLSALSLSTLFAVGVAELWLRLAIPSSDVDAFVYRTDTNRYRVMRSNIRGRVYGVPFETNSAGFRARRAYTVQKAENVKRIVVLGDSMTVCAGVSFEDLCTTRLERLINERFREDRFEVYSLAVGGHQLLHHRATLAEVGLGYDPDLILLFLFPDNDFEAGKYDVDRKRD